MFPEGLPTDYSVLWVVEGGFKAANAYQINSGFQGKKLQWIVMCLPVLQCKAWFHFT